MKKTLLFCLFITPIISLAAANNSSNQSSFNHKDAQRFLFLGRRALQQGNFEQAKAMFEKSAELGYPAAIEALANLQQLFTEYNQPEAKRKVILKRD